MRGSGRFGRRSRVRNGKEGSAAYRVFFRAFDFLIRSVGFLALLGTIEALNNPRFARNGVNGWVRVMTTVWGPVVRTDAMGLKNDAQRDSGPLARSREKTTSSAVGVWRRFRTGTYRYGGGPFFTPDDAALDEVHPAHADG